MRQQKLRQQINLTITLQVLCCYIVQRYELNNCSSLLAFSPLFNMDLRLLMCNASL